jgi:predicted metalloprotease with PDZ domain
MLAAIWDARLRSASGGRVSLDDVMRAQRAAVAQSRGTSAYQLFPKVAARFGLDVGADLDRYVDRGEPIELPADVFGPCAKVSWREQATYDRGWDTKATLAAADVVTGLRQGSPAWQAGMRDGMKLLARSFDHPDDSTAELMIRARLADGSEREFRFKPEGQGTIRVQHVDVAACATASSF